MFNFIIKVEGAYLENGKSLSNWDVFSHIPGKQPTKPNQIEPNRIELKIQFNLVFRFR